MLTGQIMTQNVITVSPETTVAAAAETMLDHHISGLPVIENGKLVGVVTEGDFLRRTEIGTEQGKRPSWLQFLLGSGRAAADYVQAHGRKVADVMTRDPRTVSESTPLQDLVTTMEAHHVKRLPVMRDGKLVGIVTRANLLRVISTMARDVTGPAASDEDVRARLIVKLMEADWRPDGLQVVVRDGVAHLHGVITDDRARQAVIVAAETTPGVTAVRDHLILLRSWAGVYTLSPEDQAAENRAG